MPSELLYFHRGLSYDARSALQQPGNLRSAKNISFEVEGEQDLRVPLKKVNSTAIGAIHSVRRFKDIIIVADTTNLRFRSALTDGNFTVISAAVTNAAWYFDEYKDFLYAVNGTEELLIDGSGNTYPARVANPITAPSGASGAAGNPSGSYYLYVSYLIEWPNGHTYETGLSDASADVSVTSEKISWSAIPLCPYAATYGTAPTIKRKLYRGPGATGSLGDIYYVDTIADNTTATYTDDETDANITAAGVCYTTDYEPGPAGQSFVCFHYGRAFIIDSANKHRLYFSEPASGITAAENEVLFPIASLEDNWDDIRVSGFRELDPQGIVSWGINLYIPLKDTWVRKQGNDPDTWAYRKTYACYGVSAPGTVARCPSPNGIIYLTMQDGGNPGLALFNGQTAELFTSPKFDYLFKEDLNQTYISTCVGICTGRYYLLAYPSGNATVPDTLIAFDLRRFPDIRAAEWTDTYVKSMDNYEFGSNFYIGGSDGYLRKNDPTYAEAIDIEVETHDCIGGNPQLACHEKYLSEFRYALNSDSSHITMTIYIDGTAATWPDGTTTRTIEGTGEAVQIMKNFPTNFRGYRFRIKLTASDLTTFTLYSPWELIFDVKA